MTRSVKKPDAEFSDTTGLPELPEGYYWHISIRWPEYSSEPVMNVSLRQRKRIGWRTTDAQDITLGYLDPRDEEEGRDARHRRHNLVKIKPEDYPLIAQNTSLEVLEKQKERFADEKWYAEYNVAREAIVGNYPPKKLEA